MKKDGLKYKDLDIKEVDKIIKKDKLNFNNSRIYSSILLKYLKMKKVKIYHKHWIEMK